MPVVELRMFPKDHVWIPTSNGYTHRAVHESDKRRRALVKQLLTYPKPLKLSKLTDAARRSYEMHKAEAQKAIREELRALPMAQEDQWDKEPS